jgi:hypothetical protein
MLGLPSDKVKVIASSVLYLPQGYEIFNSLDFCRIRLLELSHEIVTIMQGQGCRLFDDYRN